MFELINKNLNHIHKDIQHGFVELNKRLDKMRQSMDDLAKAITDYATKVQAYIDAANANQQTSDQIVAAAIAADNAGEDVDLAKMKADLDAAAAKVPEPPVPPVVA